MHFSQPVVSDLLGRHSLWNHPDSPASAGNDRIGNGSHQADTGPAIDQVEATHGQNPTQLFGYFQKERIASRLRTTEDTDPIHG